MKRPGFPALVTFAVLVFFYFPIALLVANSFNKSRFGGNWEGFSTIWYEKLFEDREIWSALENTLIVALIATTSAVVLGTLAALALHRYKSGLQRFHYAMIYTPLVVPDILMGMSLLLLFVAIGFELGRLTILLAHITFCTSYVTMVVLARLQDFDHSIMEAAYDLGANSWTATWRVLLPQLYPGIAAGALLAFTLSIDDFVVTFFVSGPGSTTLPLLIYSKIKHGSLPVINALSAFLLLITFTAVWLSQRLVNRRTP